MAENRQYDHEYKVQAVKPAKETGQAEAAGELGSPKNTMYVWMDGYEPAGWAVLIWVQAHKALKDLVT